MTLLSWAPASWKAAAWRVGSWLSDTFSPSPKRTFTVGSDLRVLAVGFAARVSEVLTDVRSATVEAVVARARIVAADIRTLTPAPTTGPFISLQADPRFELVAPDERIMIPEDLYRTHVVYGRAS